MVTSEVGDSWINGYAGDATKMSLYRIVAGAYSECARLGQCDLSDGRLASFSRFALKSPEHTWGLGPLDGTEQYLWANADLQAALTPNSGIPVFLSHQNSYIEQRNVTAIYALEALQDHPLRAIINERLSEATPAVPILGEDYSSVPMSLWTQNFSISLPGGGIVTLAFDGIVGGLSFLSINGSSNLAVSEKPLASLVYREFNGTDWAEASTCPIAYQRFGDDAAGARSSVTRASMDALYTQTGNGPRSFVIHATLPEDLTLLVGAPADIWLNFTVTLFGDILIDVQLFNKTTTRFGEAVLLEWLFSSSNLSPTDGVWRIDKIGSWVDPLDVVSGGSTQQHAVGQGVAFFSPTSGITDGGLFLDSIDAPVICTATGTDQSYTTLPLSSEPLKGPVTGFASILTTNAWAMNFPLWCLDSSLRFRFRIRVVASST